MERKTVIILAIAGGAFAYIIIALIIVISFYNKSDSSQAGAFASVKKYLMEKTKAVEAENADNAQADENAAQTEEIAGLSKEEAAAEDAELLRIIEDEDSDLRGLLDGFVYDEHDNSLLQGDSEAVSEFLHGGTGGHSYIQQNQPANRPDIGAAVQQWWYFLTKEQIEYLIYSICGKRVDFDISIWASDSVYGQYFGFGGGIGDRIEYDSLEQFSVERVGADTWKVRATDIYNTYYGDFYAKSNVCFTVIRNPDSCFDGYSLTNFEENPLDKSWARAYHDYMITDPDGLVKSIWEYEDTSWQDGYYELVYLDDDAIPELYVQNNTLDSMSGYPTDGVILYMSGGKAKAERVSSSRGIIDYVPYAGLTTEEGHNGGYAFADYKLENGKMTVGRRKDSLDIDGKIKSEGYQVNGRDVTEEKYWEAMSTDSGHEGQSQGISACERYTKLPDFLNDISQR